LEGEVTVLPNLGLIFVAIMLINHCKLNVKTAAGIVIMAGWILLTFYTVVTAQEPLEYNLLPVFVDTIPASKIEPGKDTLKSRAGRDTVKIDTLPMSTDSLDAIVNYAAEDSGVLMVPEKMFILYGKAKTDYKDIKLEAAVIEFNQQSQMVKAFGSTDSSGNPYSKPQFTQGEMKTVSDSIFYSMKSNKGIIKNTYLQEGEIYVNAQTLKKVGLDESFGKDVRFTTCNLDEPHFAFKSNKMKLINNKLAVTGRVYPEIESIPIGISSKYLKRYKYTGSVSVSFLNNKVLNRSPFAKDEFNQNRAFMITWGHTRDSRARPGTNLSANVNFGSSRFNQNLLNNPFLNFQNQLQSNINYSKDWRGKYNLSLNLNHNQNSNTKLVNLNLPTANFNVVTFFPFQKKDRVGTAKWYEKLGIGYNGNFQNLISFYDTAFNLLE